jgi:hypothetical protein
MKIKYFMIILIWLLTTALNLLSQSNYCYSIDQSRSKWRSPDTVSTGIDENLPENDLFSINVFPNPFENNIKLTINSKVPQNYQIRIINILGIEVFNLIELVNSIDYKISIIFDSYLNSGIYLLIVSELSYSKSKDTLLTYRIIKM